MRVLVARAGALGDVLLLRPALHALRQAGHAVTLLAPLGSARLLATDVDDWQDFEGPTTRALFAGDPWELGEFDLALLVSRSTEMAVAFAAVATRVCRVDPIPEDTHAARFYADAVADHAPWAGVPPPLRVEPHDPAVVDDLVERLPVGFVSIHPGSGSTGKNWAGFGEFLDTLAPSSWLLVEGPADAETARPLRGRPGVVHARGLDVRDLAAVLRHAGVHVGNDSGVSHLAAACGAPTVAVFGPTDPRAWAPVGPRVRVVSVSTGALGEVPVQAVAAAARSMLR